MLLAKNIPLQDTFNACKSLAHAKRMNFLHIISLWWNNYSAPAVRLQLKKHFWCKHTFTASSELFVWYSRGNSEETAIHF